MNWKNARKLLFAFFVMTISTVSFADTVWIDVRSAAEYQADHIQGDIRISHNEIVRGVSQLFPEKSTEIRLYCRSGARANFALSELNKAGYNKVSNAGSIQNARKERHDQLNP